MDTEYEIKVLDINKSAVEKRILALGGKFEADLFFRRYVFNTIPKKESEWIRLRTDGTKTTLTFKKIHADSIDGVKEIETEVDSFEKTLAILENAGLKPHGYQENKRKLFSLDGVEVSIDEWPKIPAYLEIEGKNQEEVENVIDKLALKPQPTTSLSTTDVYSRYGLDIESFNPLVF